MSKTPEEMKQYLKMVRDQRDKAMNEVYKKAAKYFTECWRVVIIGYKNCSLTKILEDSLLAAKVIYISFTLEELPFSIQLELQALTGSPNFPKVWANGKYICAMTEEEVPRYDPAEYGYKILQKILKNIND